MFCIYALSQLLMKPLAFSALYSTETMLPPFTRIVMYSLQPWLNCDIWAV